MAEKRERVFSVSNFRSEVTNYLQPYTFDTEIRFPNSVRTELRLNDLERGLRLRTESVTLPGTSFAEVDNYKPYGNGLVISIPHTATIQSITCVHVIDANGLILQAFYDWANKIVDLKNEGSAFGPAGKYSAYYYDDYVGGDMVINMYALNSEHVRKYTLTKPYPSSYDQIQMGWGQGGEIVKLSVTYKFEKFKIETP